jgi:hypothetical protein
MLALAGCLACRAQELPSVAISQSPQHAREMARTPKGTVTGTVYCGDTNAPARLASVHLLRVGGESGPSFTPQTFAETDLEGRFTMPKVPEGAYYVVTSYPGYLESQLPMLRELNGKPLTDDEIKQLGPSVPRVTVSSKQAATVSIRLERGAEIDGTVLYDDGSPAPGLHITVLPKSATADQKQADPSLLPGAFETANRETDARGRFRVLGLPSGEYVVAVQVPAHSADDDAGDILSRLISMNRLEALLVYYGDTLRASKAKAIKIEAGDATKDADITIPLSKLHTIRGRVIFKSTGEAPPTTALELLYADDREVARVAIATDGEFALAYVGEDSYILRAAGQNERMPTFEDMEDGDGEGGGVFFQPATSVSLSIPGTDGISGKDFPGTEVPVAVSGDVSDITISVPDPPVAKTGAKPAPPATSEQP